MLGYSDEPQILVSAFMAYRNDIDIYTEDEDKDKEFYTLLLQKLVDKRIRINDVNPLGCKQNVITACLSNTNTHRKRLYIIDGDIGLIHGLNKPEHPDLHVLDAYCVENLLLDEKTVTQFIYFNCATKPLQQIKSEVDFNTWLSKYTETLITLFLHYALADLFELKFKLYNAQKYHKNKGGQEIYQDEAVRLEIEAVKQQILNVKQIEDYTHNYDLLKKDWDNNIGNLLTIVSGKDFLIPILLIKTKAFKKSKALPSLEEVKLMLVNLSDLRRFRFLKMRIESMVTMN